MDTLFQILPKLYTLLYRRYGPQHWWPSESRFEIVVGAILTQNTNWRNVERALANLKEAGAMSPNRILEIPQDILAALIRPSGYFNSKAKKLKAFANVLVEHHNGDLNHLFGQPPLVLRQELLSIYGIGNETADDIMLYAAGLPSFVIDSYTVRIMTRLGVISGKLSYHVVQELFHRNLPSDASLFNEFHALLDRHGKERCRRVPACMECCLLSLCPTGTRLVERKGHSGTESTALTIS